MRVSVSMKATYYGGSKTGDFVIDKVRKVYDADTWYGYMIDDIKEFEERTRKEAGFYASSYKLWLKISPQD